MIHNLIHNIGKAIVYHYSEAFARSAKSIMAFREATPEFEPGPARRSRPHSGIVVLPFLVRRYSDVHAVRPAVVRLTDDERPERQPVWPAASVPRAPDSPADAVLALRHPQLPDAAPSHIPSSVAASAIGVPPFLSCPCSDIHAPHPSVRRVDDERPGLHPAAVRRAPDRQADDALDVPQLP